MDKNATDFALMAGAFSADEKMARQVCRLLADGDVNEATARKMLRLVSDGKLANDPAPCTFTHYFYPATYTPSYPSYPTWTYTTSDVNSDGTLTSMANRAIESAS